MAGVLLTNRSMSLVATAIVVTLLLACTSEGEKLTYKGLSLDAPREWRISGSVIYDEREMKVAEFREDGSRHLSLQQFIDEIRAGLSDVDPPSELVATGDSVVSGKKMNWACVKALSHDGHGGAAYWYSRSFLISLDGESIVITFYSVTGCDDGFESVEKLAASITRLKK